jgi:hypothetical protein
MKDYGNATTYSEILETIAGLRKKEIELGNAVRAIERQIRELNELIPVLYYVRIRGGETLIVGTEDQCLAYMIGYASQNNLFFDNLGLGNAYVYKRGDHPTLAHPKSAILSYTRPGYKEWDRVLKIYTGQGTNE